MAEEETLELDFEPMEEIGVGENEDLDVADKLDLPESSEDEKEQSPQKSVINELVSPRKRDRRAISPPDFEEEFRVSSHLAGRLTRVRDNESHDRPKLTPLRTITRKDWGLETPAEDSALTNEEIAKVYESLDVDLDDNRIQLNTIFVKGIDSFNEYEIEKIFAEYEPISSRQGMPIVRFVDRNKSECVLTFKNLYKVAEMFLGMSKELKRVRPAKKPEEGEVMDSEDDEEGQVREENGEDVAVVNSESLTKPISSRLQNIADDTDYIEVDVEKVDVPPGKWRVITKHVPGNHLIIARYARISEINKANRNPINFTSARQASDEKDEQDFQWGSTKDRVRPGLNIFDEKGRELEWDYEHDTRFYEDPNIANDAADKKVEKSSTSETTQSEETLKVGDRVIHSRGRGAKKFVLKSSSSEEDSD